VTVSWTEVAPIATPETAATSYRVDFRRGHQEGGLAFATFTTTASALTVAIPPGFSGDFNVVVTPVSIDGAGPPSFRRDFTICAGVPAALVGLTGSVSDGVARLVWQVSPGATAYRGSVGSVRGAGDLIPLIDLGSRPGIEARVDGGFEAWVRIWAVNACGSSAPADVWLSGRQ
jgi:hypothetical protein